MVVPEQVEIGERTFYVSRMDAFAALKIFGDLQRDVLPAIVALGPAVFAKEQAAALDDAAVAAAARQIATALDGNALERWCERLLFSGNVAVDIEGEPMTAKLSKGNRHKAFTEFTDIIELLVHVLRIEFAGPLAAWTRRTGLADKLRTALPSADTASA